MAKYSLVVGLFLFLCSSVFYGYLTGATFLIPASVRNNSLFHVAIFLFMAVGILGITKLSVAYYSSYIANWSSRMWPALLCLAVAFMLAFVPSAVNVGEFFRIYIAPASLVVVLIVHVFNRHSHCTTLNKSHVFILQAGLCLLTGIGLYLIKDVVAFNRNGIFSIQIILSALCFVFPVYFFLLGVFSWKQSRRSPIM